MTILPSHWPLAFRPLPPSWLALHAPDLLRRVPDFPRFLRQAAEGVGVAEHLLVTRCQLEQSAITYAWNGSSGDYGGGAAGDEEKLRYLCGADKTDSGPRPGGWFGPERQLLACALRFRYWYRGKDGPRPEWRNWLGLEEDPAFAPGVPVTRGGVTITPDNQASADCLRYTTGLAASLALERLGRMWFAEEYETMAKSTLTQMAPTMEEFGAWLRSQTPGHGKVLATVLHHTWDPTAAKYKGLASIQAIRNYHKTARGWGDIGANAYACPDGTVFTGRPLSAENWAHALVRRTEDNKRYDWPKVEAEARALAGGNGLWFNQYAFGLETVANFDSEPTDTGSSGMALETALRVLTVVHTVYGLPASRLFFHRDVADKSCPGRKLDRARVRADLARRLGGGSPDSALGIVRLGGPGGDQLLPCNPNRPTGGPVWVGLRGFVEGIGGSVHWTPEGIVVRDDTGAVVDVSAFCVLVGEEYRCPLRPLASAVGWPVKEPPHLGDDPPRVYVHRRP